MFDEVTQSGAILPQEK